MAGLSRANWPDACIQAVAASIASSATSRSTNSFKSRHRVLIYMYIAQCLRCSKVCLISGLLKKAVT